MGETKRTLAEKLYTRLCDEQMINEENFAHDGYTVEDFMDRFEDVLKDYLLVPSTMVIK